MKRKIIAITAMLAVMVAMIGTAAALHLGINGDNPVSIKPGQSIILDVTMSDPNSHVALPHDISITGATVTCNTLTPLCTTGDLKVEGNMMPFPHNFVMTSNPFTHPNCIKVTLNALTTDPIGTEYVVHLAGDDITGGELNVIADKTFENIPEFPTVALPIAAVIGLVFFFQQKKIKEGK